MLKEIVSFLPFTNTIMQLSEHLLNLQQKFAQELEKVASEQALEELRVHYLGRNGLIIELLTNLKNLPLDEKKTYGPALNKFRQDAHHAIEHKKESLRTEHVAALRRQLTYFDVTAYQPSYRKGSLHPYSHVVQNIENIFMSMGYMYAEGPEIEDPAYNFDALNIPKNHPARDLHDTFWLTIPEKLLRTHTSSVQIRTLQQHQPPLAVFAPGRVFRHEATDATHDFMFMQLEGLFIDKGVSLAHLLATLKTFMRSLFNIHTLDIRVRPSYFPFVEPGLEVDISCPFCTSGCSLCKKTRWIELGGAGLVHPEVLRYCSIDPNTYSGFAFGLGIERFAMLKYNLTDIRLFHTGAIDFLKQF